MLCSRFRKVGLHLQFQQNYSEAFGVWLQIRSCSNHIACVCREHRAVERLDKAIAPGAAPA